MEKDKDGKLIDTYSDTVEDAAAFEAYFNSDQEDYEELFSDLFNPLYDLDPEEFDETFSYCEYDDLEYDNDCKCSDHYCPCSGSKIGKY